jgi:hypothetical protein
MKLVKGTISIFELNQMAEKMFGNLVKAVVDIETGSMVVDADLHADQESYLIQNGSKQENLWGINIYPNKEGADMIEFDSMINLRPSQGNNTRGVESLEIQKLILDLVNRKITE